MTPTSLRFPLPSTLVRQYEDLVLGKLYGESATFLHVEEYPNLLRWANQIRARPAVIRGRLVNRTWGDEGQLPERHSSADFDKVTNTHAQ